MKQNLPNPEIINDLLIENWQLRWKVLETFHRVRNRIRNHAQISAEQKDILRLGRKLAACLNGPSDRNLHLIMTAAYFLGGNHFLFLIFQHLGIDDSDDLYPAISDLKKNLCNEDHNSTFFDYFLSLLSSIESVERTTAVAAAIAIRIFSPEKALHLLISIPLPEPRLAAFDLFVGTHPNHSFNNFLFLQQAEILSTEPELLRFITPPLTPEQTQKCITLVKRQLGSESNNKTTAIRAIGRLKLDRCRPMLQNLAENNLEIATTYAQLGDECGCRRLLAASKSWRQKKRCAALSGLAFCDSTEALSILKNSASKGDRNERHQILIALSRNRHPDALSSLITIFTQTSKNSERRLILTLIGQHPNAAPNSKTANLLAQWYNDNNLFPELLEALSIFGYGDKWKKIITKFKTPVTLPHHQKIALFMARFADRPAIKEKLLELLSDIDWAFSFRLLTLLQPHLNGADLKILLNLLQEHENARKLTISESLTKGNNFSDFNGALCEFLNSNPVQAGETLSRFVIGLMEGSLPTNNELTTEFQQKSPELKKLLLDCSDFSHSLPEAELPLLHILKLLSEITLDGSSCLAAVINQTRKYGGFIRQLIIRTINTLIDQDHLLQSPKALPDLQAVINYIRRRPGYDELRQKILLHITKTSRNAKDLRIYLGANQDRDLRILHIRRKSADR
ncbi:MAG: HEAT repeat domain-containing protein [Deltaproteobacteria bacterium]|nr:HEAT repeat domain-containing protein [Candidatus Tharpella aukensis]